MPENIKELCAYIFGKEEISVAVGRYAAGCILSEMAEWMAHEEKRTSGPITHDQINQWICQQPDSKIDRSIQEAQQSFGVYAYQFLEPSTKERIRAEIDSSIVSTVRSIESSVIDRVRSYTSGWRAFGMNVVSGLVAGILFAALTFGAYEYVKIDPSANAMGKGAVEKAPPPPPPAP